MTQPRFLRNGQLRKRTPAQRPFGRSRGRASDVAMNDSDSSIPGDCKCAGDSQDTLHSRGLALGSVGERLPSVHDGAPISLTCGLRPVNQASMRSVLNRPQAGDGGTISSILVMYHEHSRGTCKGQDGVPSHKCLEGGDLKVAWEAEWRFRVGLTPRLRRLLPHLYIVGVVTFITRIYNARHEEVGYKRSRSPREFWKVDASGTTIKSDCHSDYTRFDWEERCHIRSIVNVKLHLEAAEPGSGDEPDAYAQSGGSYWESPGGEGYEQDPLNPQPTTPNPPKTSVVPGYTGELEYEAEPKHCGLGYVVSILPETPRILIGTPTPPDSSGGTPTPPDNPGGTPTVPSDPGDDNDDRGGTRDDDTGR